jgi:hypothetical protein
LPQRVKLGTVYADALFCFPRCESKFANDRSERVEDCPNVLTAFRIT